MSCAGLVPIEALAQRCDLAALADEHARNVVYRKRVAVVPHEPGTSGRRWRSIGSR